MAVLVVATLTVALAGCGAGSTDDAATTSTLAGPPLTVSSTDPGGAATTSTVASVPATTTSGAGGPTAPPASTPVTSGPGAATSTARAPPQVSDVTGVRVGVRAVAQLDEPIAIGWRTGDPATYVAERGGRLRVLRDDALDPEPVLDFAERTRAGGERGFLGFAYAPTGDRLYVDYTDPQGDSHVDEYTVAPDGTIAVESRREVLFQDQPFPNHNGGQVVFGPDGYLYIGFGDGGSANDPRRNGLNLDTWLGKILRIDPRANGAEPYSVPPDNPFVGRPGARPEIWSFGLRNPWRFTFDAATGDLWVADVGERAREEVDVVVAAAGGAGRGTNFGWSAYEGTRAANADQSAPDAVAPVYEYPHGELGCSITGGYVYRGTALPALAGAYLFADYCTTGVRALVPGGGQEPAVVTDGPEQIVSFGQGPDGEVYVLSLDGTVGLLVPA